MALEKQCRQCKTKFAVTADDLIFYKKISPTFAGKTYEMPAPTLCPDCRQQIRFAFRNVVKLYKRKCDLCQKDIITVYSPDKKVTVYCQQCWWSDKWEPLKYGRDFDPLKPFFQQFAELKTAVPKAALMNVKSENSEYTNLADGNRDCYLLFLAGNNESVYYGYYVDNCKSCVDLTFGAFSELCYEGINLGKCYNINWSINCGNCRDSYFIEDCNSCADCILCSCLYRKRYCYKNQQLEKDEYEKVKKEFLAGLETKIDEYRKEFREIIISRPKKFSQMLRSENCSGEDIFDSKNCQRCFMMTNCEDCKFCYGMFSTKDSYDVSGFGNTGELLYQGTNIGLGTTRSSFISFAYQLSNSFYCDHCYYCDSLFGCVGVKNHKKHCILNKQYSEEEYKATVAKIIGRMQKDEEWGEWFSNNVSAFGYNETIANDYYPLSKEEAQKLGFGWQDDDFSLKFDGTPYEPKAIVEYAKSEKLRQELLDGVLKCKVSGRPYKITPQELHFYIRNKIPIPQKHFETRFTERFNLINHIKLFHRQCDCEETDHDHEGRCKTEFETSYPPEKPEKVYCEKCYWDEEK
ncbi:MAG: hypothetical protein OEV37_00995 [Candidatus Berkelbacteria bacterium]|nr:hypothetical protein [Candidatus Berkelbacteria bacterium]